MLSRTSKSSIRLKIVKIPLDFLTIIYVHDRNEKYRKITLLIELFIIPQPFKYFGELAEKYICIYTK